MFLFLFCLCQCIGYCFLDTVAGIGCAGHCVYLCALSLDNVSNNTLLCCLINSLSLAVLLQGNRYNVSALYGYFNSNISVVALAGSLGKTPSL